MSEQQTDDQSQKCWCSKGERSLEATGQEGDQHGHRAGDHHRVSHPQRPPTDPRRHAAQLRRELVPRTGRCGQPGDGGEQHDRSDDRDPEAEPELERGAGKDGVAGQGRQPECAGDPDGHAHDNDRQQLGQDQPAGAGTPRPAQPRQRHLGSPLLDRRAEHEAQHEQHQQSQLDHQQGHRHERLPVPLLDRRGDGGKAGLQVGQGEARVVDGVAVVVDPVRRPVRHRLRDGAQPQHPVRVGVGAVEVERHGVDRVHPPRSCSPDEGRRGSEPGVVRRPIGSLAGDES